MQWKRRCTRSQAQAFRLEEATIDDLHAAIRSGETTVVAVVQHYLARVRAYNGVASVLVTQDGAPVAAGDGRGARRRARCKFPTQTVKASTILPDLDKYKGPPLEFGRMEATASKPDVQQQFGMIVGIPNAGQLNAHRHAQHPRRALGHLLGRVRQASVARARCRRTRRRSASSSASSPTRWSAPPSSTRQFGRNPDLEKMPMYGVVFSFKDPFDTKDMRSTGGGDARYDIDFPARDHVLVEQLRNKGAIIFAKAVNTEYNGRAGDPGGRNKPDKVLPSTLGYQRSTWAGNPSNPYDTTRSASLGSSSGSGVSVSANLVMASLGEETRASCRGPSNHNAVALILPHKAMLGFDGGAIGADIYCDRTGIHARKIGDCAKILDALKDPEQGYYDPRDPFTTVPRSSVLSTPYAGHAKGDRRGGRAEGHAARRDPRVDGLSAGLEDRGADRRRGDEGDQRRARRPARRDAGGVRRSVVDARSRRRADDGRFPQGAGAARAGVHAGPAVPREGATARRCSRISPPRSCRPSSRRERCSARARCSRSTIASRWPKAASRRREISTSPPSRTRRWRWRSASTSRST